AVPERVLLMAADAHALAEIRCSGEYPGLPAQTGLTQPPAEILIVIQQARFIPQTLAIRRITYDQPLLVLVGTRLESRYVTLVDANPAGQSGTFDVIASRLNQARIGFVTA